VAWCGGGSRAFSIVGGNDGANIGHGGEETKLLFFFFFFVMERSVILARKAYTYLMPSCQTVRSFEPLEHRKAWSQKTCRQVGNKSGRADKRSRFSPCRDKFPSNDSADRILVVVAASIR
jgi:hypothetical protein